MIYGYCRISTPQQNIQRQIDNIKKLNDQTLIIKEAYTGTTTNRPEWNKLYKKLQQGDTVIFDEVSRMSRNAQEGFELYQELIKKGVELIFIKERHIDTKVYKQALEVKMEATGNKVIDCVVEGINKALMELAKQQIEIAFNTAEAEVTFLRQRTKEGIARAKLEGKQIGRVSGSKHETKKAKEVKAVILKHAKAFGGSLKDTEVLKMTGIDRHTYYKYKAELKEQEN